MMLGELNGLNGDFTREFEKYMKPIRISGIQKDGSALKPILIKVATQRLELLYFSKYK